MAVVGMAMSLVVVVMVVRLDADQVHGPETNAALGPNLVGECAHCSRLSVQHDALQGMVMIEVNLGDGGDQLVVGVAQLR